MLNNELQTVSKNIMKAVIRKPGIRYWMFRKIMWKILKTTKEDPERHPGM